MKLVDLGKGDGLERFRVHQEVTERWDKIYALAKDIRDAVDALDHEEYSSYIEQLDLTLQDINEVCMVVENHARFHRRLANRVIRHLRELKPQRIWRGRR